MSNKWRMDKLWYSNYMEAPILWPPDVKNWLIGKAPDAGKDWRQEEKGTTDDVITDLMHMSLSKLQVMDREALRAAVHGVAKSQPRLTNWTDWTWLRLENKFPRIPFFCYDFRLELLEEQLAWDLEGQRKSGHYFWKTTLVWPGVEQMCVFC